MKYRIEKDRKTERMTIVITNPPKTKPIEDKYEHAWTCTVAETDGKTPMFHGRALAIPNTWGNEIRVPIRRDWKEFVANQKQLQYRIKTALKVWLKQSKENNQN